MASRSRFASRPAALAALVLAAGLLGACASGHAQSALSPAGPVAKVELQLIAESLWIMVGVFVVVAGLLVFALVRYHERSGDQHIPKQVEGDSRLELLWTIVPFILLIILAVPTFTQTFALAATQTGPNVLDVTVVGHQWWWQFDYPSLGIVTADEMHIPAGTRIELTLESADVLHSFWVPPLAGKEDNVPGRKNTMWLEADQPGTFPGQCAEFCGTSHSEMRLLVVAQSASAFTQWAQGFQQPGSQPQTPQAQDGMQVFQTNCSSCHAIGGTTFQGGQTASGFPIAPNLTDLSAHVTLAGGTLANDSADLIQWINNPQALMPDAIMPAFQGILTQTQEQDVAAYLEGLT